MKTKLAFLLLLPLTFMAMSCGVNKNNNNSDDTPEEPPVVTPSLGPIDVVIISGQSNAVGCSQHIFLADSMPEKYDEYCDGYPEIQIAYDCWTKTWPSPTSVGYEPQNTSPKNKFTKVALGQGNRRETFGPEVGIADKLLQYKNEQGEKKYANKVCIIKFACGGSNLKDDWLALDSPMYPRLVEYVRLQMNNLKDKGYEPVIKAFCWMQGEGDSYSGYYQYYLANLRTFVYNMRNEFRDLANNEDIPFIDAGISSYSEWQYYKQVNEAKASFATESERNFYIDTIAAGMHTNLEPPGDADGYHYDSDSEILLGYLFAEAFIPFLS